MGVRRTWRTRRARFAWGDDFAPKGRMLANTWQGEFPWQNTMDDGFEGTSPVRSFPPNGYGLYDVAGNVWEWTDDFFAPRHTDPVEHACCAPHNPRTSSPEASFGLGQPGEHIPRRVIKAGPTCVRRAIACATDLPLARPRPSTRVPAISASAASSGRRDAMLTIGLFCAGLLVYALFSRLLDRVSLTAQILMIAIGVVLGIAVRGTPETTVDIELLGVAGELALILALVVDAARIDIGALRKTAGIPIRLLAIGLPLTIVAGTIVAMLLLPGITVIEAVIVATLLAPTDAALGAMVVNSPIVPRRIRQALNVESGLNDGLVTPIVLVAAAVAVVGGDPRHGLDPRCRRPDLVRRFGRGRDRGTRGAGAARRCRPQVDAHGTHWMAAPAIGFLAWFVAHELGGNVFVAAFVAGLAMTATYGHVPESFLEFAEVGGELLGLMVFFLFGALLAGIGGAISLPVLIYAVLSLTIIRMLPVAIALRGTRLRAPTVAFIGWFGPRGLASIVLTLVALGDGGGTPPFGATVVAAVSLTIALSVIAHGLSAGPAVARYGAFVATLPEDAAEHKRTAELPTRRGVDRLSADAQAKPT